MDRTLNPKEDILYIAMTVAASVWRMQPANDGSARVRLHTQMICGGTDGMTVDENGNLVVANVGVGLLWIVDKRGMPVYRIESCGGKDDNQRGVRRIGSQDAVHHGFR